ncbi:exported hypothetical protein [uncultured Desulfatiglans sp.]|nr:exported hypothetical protein [uncultured Desulfatiglans sp.]
MPCILRVLLICLIGILSAHGSIRAGENPWIPFEEKGAVVDRIQIEVGDVFDLDDPKENHWLGRTANFLHIDTRQRIIRKNLLFKEGEPVNARIIAETERLLRNLPYLIDAKIVPETNPDGTVTARVRVHDAWTIRVGGKFSDIGGDQDWRVRLGDVNLLGYGKQLFVSHGKDSERTTQQIFYTDPLLFNTRWVLDTAYENLSDGDLKLFRLERGFFEYTTPWAASFAFRDESRIHTLYDRDREIYNFRFNPQEISVGLWKLLRFRHRTAIRAGVEYRHIDKQYGELNQLSTPTFSAPELWDRTYSGPLLHFSLNQDRYGSFRNLKAVSVTENYNLGWDLEFAGGYFSSAFGSETDAGYFEASVEKGQRLTPESLFLVQATGHTRTESQGFRDALGSLRFTGYYQSWPFQTLAANLDLTGGYEMDPENMIYIGAEEGLKGYPSHFRAGDARWVFALEDRVILPWDLWGIVQIGFVAFAEAGAIRSPDGGGWSKIYADVGGGLRLGNLKSAFGRVILLTVAYPLVKEEEADGFQVLIGNEVRF